MSIMPSKSCPNGTAVLLARVFSPVTLSLNKMVPLLILAFSSFALVKFGISQWRAILITAASQRISDTLQVHAGIDNATIDGQDFGSLLALCDRLSPGLRKTSAWLREVSIYYRIVTGLERAVRLKLPSVSIWANREMQLCSRYVAVVLDQDLAMNFDRQLATRLN